jgi:D-sedoheptulose 7-phosphate isomerase
LAAQAHRHVILVGKQQQSHRSSTASTAKITDSDFLADYVRRLHEATALSEERLGWFHAAREIWRETRAAGGRVVFIGNGGSAAIASHLATDLNKAGGVPTLCFNDASQITCLANDYGFENWIAHALRLNCRPSDSLVAISSSGRSPNILNAVGAARRLEMKVITLSGMEADNPLRRLGDLNLWLDSKAYNIIESAHQFWLLMVLDWIIGQAEYKSN